MRSTLAKVKRNKAVGQNGIETDMILAIDGFRIYMNSEIFIRIYDSGEILEDLTKCMFIAIKKEEKTRVNSNTIGQ